MEVAARERALNVAKSKRFAAQPERLTRRGSRVYLRIPQPRDEREFFELRRSSRKFLAPFEVRPPRAFKVPGPHVFRAFLDQGPGKARERWLICSARSGAILGAITIGTIRGEPFQSAVLGYWIGAAHARQGYMSEALPLAVGRVFKGLGLRRVEADILPGNRASKRLLRSAGFVKEGLARGFAHVAGRWQDHERWALLKSDSAKSQRPQSRR